MNWIAILKVAASAALNAALAVIVNHITSDPVVALGSAAVGTAIAHGVSSPFAGK